MPDVIFEPNDLFFDPVAAFFASWVGYVHGHATKKYDVASGRLRGFVILQLKFEDDPTIGKLQRQEPITQMRFEIDMTDPGLPNGSRVRTSHLMDFWCQQMFGHAYESVLPKIEARFGDDRKRGWPPILQFAYHVRNGCFHGNMFDIRQNAVSTHVATEWRGRAIDYTLNGTKVAGEFLAPADLIVLLHDIQALLK